MKKIVLQALDIKTNRKSEDEQQQPKTIKEPPTAVKEKEKIGKIAKRQNIAETSQDFVSEIPFSKKKAKKHLETVPEETIQTSSTMENFEREVPVYSMEKAKRQQHHLKSAPEPIKKSRMMKSSESESPITMKEHLRAVAEPYGCSPLTESYDSELPLLPQKRKKVVKISPTPSKGAESLGRSSGGRASTSSHMSRLSSGFGSLQDEGSTTVLQDEEESRAVLQDEWNAKKMASHIESHPQHFYGERHSHDLKGNPLDARGKPLDFGGHFKHGNGNQKYARDPQTGNGVIHGQHYYTDKQASPIQAWTTPDPTSRVYESSLASSVAPSSEGRRSLALADKQEALQCSKLLEQKLAKNVQLLNLKVSEEQLS